MEPPEQNDLEKFIHAQLRQLPEREAPEGLVNNVLEAIAKRKKLPWWKQSFLFWPKQLQAALFVTLGAAFAAAAYGAALAWNHLQVPEISNQLSAWAGLYRSARLLAEALFSTVSSLPMQWLAGLGVVFLLLYGACLATGFALFRVTAGAGARA